MTVSQATRSANELGSDAAVADVDAQATEIVRAALLRCCASEAWADAVLAKCPFLSLARLHQAADDAWRSRSREEWLAAFAAHPRIGSRADVAKKSGTERAWSSSEQAGVDAADDAVKLALADVNARYELRFGFIFLICATGKAAREMLEACVERLEHDRDAEIAIAADEQRKILHLRIDKWIDAWMDNGIDGASAVRGDAAR